MSAATSSSKGSAKPSSGSSISLAGLPAVIEDARQATLSSDAGPAEPKNYANLVARLNAAKDKFPPLYHTNFCAPFIATIEALGATAFAKILARDPDRESTAGLLFDLAQAILQPGEDYQQGPTRAYQEYISDLYDGYLGAESRHGVKPPDRGVIPPLVKWGNPDFGPYTWPVDATASFKVKAGVVNLPPANASAGLVAWGALGHETSGHDILHADNGLLEELTATVQSRLAPLGHGLADYWSLRMDETASDVQGLLNLGPAAGIGLVAYFRGLLSAYGGKAVLRNEGPAGDPHPADIVRGYLASEVVALLSFKGAKAWATAIAKETDKDVKKIVLAGQTVPTAVAKKSAKLIAQSLVQTKLKSLEKHALGEIQNWADSDEALVASLRVSLRDGTPIDFDNSETTIYAAHLVAAAIIEACATGHDIAGLQNRLIAALNRLHDKNPSWGPLYVAHPSDICRDFFISPKCRQI
ncbi:MAG TPA: hypothetical protein VF518_14665 [Polyangia bacterium]